MKNSPFIGARLVWRAIISCVVALLLNSSPAARARTITLSLEFTRFQYSLLDPYYPGQAYYTVKTIVSSDVPPITYDEVDSSTNNSAFGASENGNGITPYPDIGSAVNAATNGAWTLTVNKGDVSQQQYTFTVSATGLPLTDANLPTVQIAPPDGDLAVSINSAFAWTGPAIWSELDLVARTPDYSFYMPDSPSPATTSWSAAPLPLGTNLFEVTYKTNASAWITISTPLNNLSQPFTNWVGGAKLVDYAESGFVTSTNPFSLTDINTALDTTNLYWAVSGDANWFVETTNTDSGSPSAAQSGSVTNTQSSTLFVSVTGPGTLTFDWSSIANDTNGGFDYEFYLDNDPINNDLADLYSGVNAWAQAGPFTIPAGPHTLSWTVYANNDTDSTQAGFLDQVSFVAGAAPVITLNPLSQTNYPGYIVALYAAATSNPAATWQWYEVGSGAISGATNTLFTPTNSGTAGVAGSYYAVASNLSGSANTTTAAVTFVTAPLPPGWSRAVDSPFKAEFDTNVIKDNYSGCAVDSAGEIYVADQYFGNIFVETNFVVINTLTLVGTNGGAALVKYDGHGNPLWAVGLTNNDPASSSYGDCVALAPGNGAYLAVNLAGTNWLGANQYANSGSGSILLSRFDASGSNVWSQFINGTNFSYTSYNDLVSDSTGNVTLAGNFIGTTGFGGTNLSVPALTGFIAQYSSTGSIRWAQTVPDNVHGLAYGGGRLYASLQAAVSGGVTNVSIGGLSNITDRAWAVACLNATNGQALWIHGVGEQYAAKSIGSVLDDAPLVSLSGSDLFLTGTAYGSTAVFGGLSVSLPGGRYQYFARYDTNGNAQVATTYGSPTTMPWAAAANASGVYVSGDFDDYSGFGNFFIAAPFYSPSYLGAGYFTQPFAAKFDRNGNALWARNGSSSVLANFRGIATTSDGVWASGSVLISDTFHPAQFGTNVVSGDAYLDYFGYGVTAFFTQGGVLAKITETTATATPVALLNPHTSGANFQFSFTSESGFTHYVQYSTNLVAGPWQTYTNIPGDGTLKTSLIPLSLFSPSKQGFIRVSTQ
jgi:hypothetical protein